MKESEKSRFWWVIGGIIIVWIMFGSAVLWIPWPDWLPRAAVNLPTRGQFGDSFGAVNALFSGAALAGLIYAILLQRRDLALQQEELQHWVQRKELELTRLILEGQEKQLSEQAETMDRQRFENTLFQMISLDDQDTDAKTMFDSFDTRLTTAYQKEANTPPLEFDQLFYDVWREALWSEQKWTPSFGQPGSGVKVDSMRFVRLPFAACIPPSEFCHGGGSSEVFPRCST